jgi:hypothetical protein
MHPEAQRILGGEGFVLCGRNVTSFPQPSTGSPAPRRFSLESLGKEGWQSINPTCSSNWVNGQIRLRLAGTEVRRKTHSKGA